MKNYTCLLVDDQKEAVELLESHINRIVNLEVRFSGNNPLDAIAFLDKNKVDIIFSDIEMPEISGLDFIESLRDKWGNEMPKIILVTGYSEYALSGYDYGVNDYLMKPVSFKRFKKSVDRILNDLSKQRDEESTLDFFFADVDGKKIKIDFNDILYI